VRKDVLHVILESDNTKLTRLTGQKHLKELAVNEKRLYLLNYFGRKAYLLLYILTFICSW